jgi:hypothetical protein
MVIRCELLDKISAMKQTFLAAYPRIGTKKKRTSVKELEKSPYYWFWAYMRRNKEYLECCDKNGAGKLAKLYQDFGDIRSEDFAEWWGGSSQKGGYLFGETPNEINLKQLKDKNEWSEDWNENIAVFAVNLSIGRRKLQQYFAAQLETIHKGKRGRKSMGGTATTARYKLYRNYSVSNLKKMLEAYDAWVKNEALPKSERKTMWELGESIRLVPVAMPPTHKDFQLQDNVKMRHNTMTVAMSRYVKQAQIIIANTSLGVFPKSTVT